MPTKQRLTKQDIKQANILDSTKEHNPLLDYLAKHHPQTISEERLNLDALSQVLGFSPSSMQGYGLSFIGKPLANALYSTPTTKELKELDSKHSQNIIIKGDNLHALKLLKSAYDGKIKMIYIDPPYNTKNDKFIYNDNFIKEYQKLLVELDLLKLDSNGKVLEKSEVLHFLTNPSGDKAHSGWLSFMLPRLKLARDLLKDDGVIFISIDDNEQANLKILCDEIFGEENFVSCFVWQKKSGGGQAKFFYEGHEYVLIYAKDKNNLQGLYKAKQKTQIDNDFIRKVHGKYTNNTKLKALYKKYPNDLIEHRNLMFEELDIFLKEQMITQEKYDEVKENLTKGVYFLNSYNDKFNLICRYNESDQSLMYSILTGFWTSDGNTEIENIFGKNIFKDPKPTNLVKQLIQSVTIINKANSATNTGGGGGRYSA
ncbi:site-specific DNA-methyltransferase [Campylobacter upsaliensis]|nr:site-specific DNA-methyltransferase [Campylobacter upsaliensis]MCR2103719.1 site-specific DNA-methyltransferase [Campylobacter upsaliensis]